MGTAAGQEGAASRGHDALWLLSSHAWFSGTCSAPLRPESLMKEDLISFSISSWAQLWPYWEAVNCCWYLFSFLPCKWDWLSAMTLPSLSSLYRRLLGASPQPLGPWLELSPPRCREIRLLEVLWVFSFGFCFPAQPRSSLGTQRSPL